MLWRQQVDGEVIGSVVTADLDGGQQDVIVPTTNGAQVLDGSTGQLIGTLERGIGLQNSPLVTDDPDGRVGVTVAGYNAHDQGVVEHFELFGSNGADVDGLGAWPMFHHDPQLTGNATAPGVTALAPDPPRHPRPDACTPPPGRAERLLRGGHGRRRLCLWQRGLLRVAGRGQAQVPGRRAGRHQRRGWVLAGRLGRRGVQFRRRQVLWPGWQPPFAGARDSHGLHPGPARLLVGGPERSSVPPSATPRSTGRGPSCTWTRR